MAAEGGVQPWVRVATSSTPSPRRVNHARVYTKISSTSWNPPRPTGPRRPRDGADHPPQEPDRAGGGGPTCLPSWGAGPGGCWRSGMRADWVWRPAVRGRRSVSPTNRPGSTGFHDARGTRPAGDAGTRGGAHDGDGPTTTDGGPAGRRRRRRRHPPPGGDRLAGRTGPARRRTRAWRCDRPVDDVVGCHVVEVGPSGPVVQRDAGHAVVTRAIEPEGVGTGAVGGLHEPGVVLGRAAVGDELLRRAMDVQLMVLVAELDV